RAPRSSQRRSFPNGLETAVTGDGWRAFDRSSTKEQENAEAHVAQPFCFVAGSGSPKPGAGCRRDNSFQGTRAGQEPGLAGFSLLSQRLRSGGGWSPRSERSRLLFTLPARAVHLGHVVLAPVRRQCRRSEERRVGKECRSRCGAEV